MTNSYPGRDLVIRGAEERLAPILMTAAATGLALVPIVIGGTGAPRGVGPSEGDLACR